MVHLRRLNSAPLVARTLPAPNHCACSQHCGCNAFECLTHIPRLPHLAAVQEAAASLCTGTADPSAADYLQAALLLAWHFNGEAAKLKGWCSDAKSNISNANATWRRTLAAVMKCRNGAVLAMAARGSKRAT